MPSTWYPLDNAGKLYPAVADSRRTTVFRLSADLSAPINAGRLQKTLDNLMPRFPFYAVHLKRGVFWYSFETSFRPVSLQRDSRFPCMRFPIHQRGAFPFRVRAWRNRVAVEFSHSLADGTAALIFLKALLAEYLHLSGVPRKECPGVPVPGEMPHEEEDQDAFARFANPSFPPPPKLEKAFRLPLDLERPGIYWVTTGIIPASELTSMAKDRESTVTEFLTAILIDGFRRLIMDMPEAIRSREAAPIRIGVPVNLRQFWPSMTMRNFFTNVEPEIDPRLGEWTFEEILERTRGHMRFEADHRFLARRIARNARGERYPLARALPLVFKDMSLPALYAALAEKMYTSGLSNLGRVSLPDHLSPWVKRMDFIPPPAVGERIKAAVIGWDDKVHLSFGRLVRPPVVERYVFRKLVSMGIPVKIESNGS